MTKKEAMDTLRMSILSQKILKQAYVKACFRFHPDRNPDGLEQMKKVNLAYSFLKGFPDDQDTTTDTDKTTMDNQGVDFGHEMNAAIDAVIDLGGLHIEICGSWVWLSGDTRTHKDAIKAAGYFWASKKMMWYWHPADAKTTSRGKFSMDDVRAKYGASEVKGKAKAKLTA
jgi:hypothetical protein